MGRFELPLVGVTVWSLNPSSGYGWRESPLPLTSLSQQEGEGSGSQLHSRAAHPGALLAWARKPLAPQSYLEILSPVRGHDTPEGGVQLPGLLLLSDRRQDSRTVCTPISLFPTQLLALALGVLGKHGAKARGLGRRSGPAAGHWTGNNDFGWHGEGPRAGSLFSRGDPLPSVHFWMTIALGQ